MKSLRIGFDFDQTLVDSSPGILLTTELVLREFLQAAEVSSLDISKTFGLPLNKIFQQFLPENQVSEAIDLYMRKYPIVGVENSSIITGASELLRLVNNLNIESVLISAKTESNLHLMLKKFDFKFDYVFGGAHGSEKGAYIRDYSVGIYIGDQESDVRASREGHCLSVIISNEYNSNYETWVYQPDFYYSFEKLLSNLPKILNSLPPRL